MNLKYICSDCHKEYNLSNEIYKCQCGGLFDLKKTQYIFSRDLILSNEWSMFRYLDVLPFSHNTNLWKMVSMGEGLTAIVPLYPHNNDILVKLDYMMPTSSFKDRGAAVLISKAKELGVTKVIQDSSGNAGNSIAAYASRAGIKCDIYVPENTSSKKIKQISSHGANVHIIKGSREDTAKAALNAIANGEGFYASHVYNPLFYQGTKTYAYEIWEQLNGDIPENIIVPVGNGTLLLGCYYGFRELLYSKLIKKLPKIIAVQTEGCAPIYNAFNTNNNTVSSVVNTGTIAEGIAIANPMRGSQIIKAIKETKGTIILAPEDKIIEAKNKLSKIGFYVEPTTAATYAAFLEYNKNNKIKGKVIIPLCGSGLKSDK
ncbi:threonine synthase [Clostridium sp. D2Q-11]|uniref:Threonine synthase n=1 Tax=Anaeromonas frigoriresistens TaxID=2683708 RepID=A0A942V1M1_9FIRM|nr:threonine synthase [Anaeromonas frigoriresistens]MBS4539517.1 threonine synthase [Anaeromonas frigoriresistens]